MKINSISPYPYGHKYYVFVIVDDDNQAWLAEEDTKRRFFKKQEYKKAKDSTGNFIPAPNNWETLTLAGKSKS